MEDVNLYLYCEDRRERTRGHGARPHPRQLILISPAQPGLPLLLLLRGQRRVAPPRHAPLHRRLCREGNQIFLVCAADIFARVCWDIVAWLMCDRSWLVRVPGTGAGPGEGAGLLLGLGLPLAATSRTPEPPRRFLRLFLRLINLSWSSISVA